MGKCERLISRAQQVFDVEAFHGLIGRGFPFRGTYDLDALNAMNQGPLTIKERVAELQGALELRSSETGTDLTIALPLTPAAA